jgi:hypothetical protein
LIIGLSPVPVLRESRRSRHHLAAMPVRLRPIRRLERARVPAVPEVCGELAQPGLREVADLRIVGEDFRDGILFVPEVLLGALRTIEVYRGRGSGIAATALGAAVGGVAGGLLARSVWKPPEAWEVQHYGISLSRETTTVLGALAGASIFGLIGHSLGAAERWESLPLSSLRVGLAPLPAGRLGLGASFNF